MSSVGGVSHSRCELTFLEAARAAIRAGLTWEELHELIDDLETVGAEEEDE